MSETTANPQEVVTPPEWWKGDMVSWLLYWHGRVLDLLREEAYQEATRAWCAGKADCWDLPKTRTQLQKYLENAFYAGGVHARQEFAEWLKQKGVLPND